MNMPIEIEAAIERFSIEHLLVLLMLGTSLILVALALERLFALLRVRLALRGAGRVVAAARAGSLADARRLADPLGRPVRTVLVAGLDRALGTVRGDAGMAMAREQRRLGGAMRARTWMIGTTGALMPFVGLFGTVLGVMSSFQAIGESGQGGFAVVSSGISQALISTAVGIAVALEAVILFNFIQNMIGKLSREVALVVDELLELILVSRSEDARPPAG